jgi:hypothetical protein
MPDPLHLLVFHFSETHKKWVGTVFCDPESWPAMTFSYVDLVAGKMDYPGNATDHAMRVTCPTCRVQAEREPWPAYLGISAPTFKFPDVSGV